MANSRFALTPGDGASPAQMVQGFEGESQVAPWYTLGGNFNPKIPVTVVPRGPLLLEIDTIQGGAQADVYLGQFQTMEAMLQAIGHNLIFAESVPTAYPLVWSVPGNTKASKVFTPSYDFVVIAVVKNGADSAVLFPVGIVGRGPSSILLAATGPDYSA